MVIYILFSSELIFIIFDNKIKYIDISFIRCVLKNKTVTQLKVYGTFYQFLKLIWWLKSTDIGNFKFLSKTSSIFVLPEENNVAVITLEKLNAKNTTFVNYKEKNLFRSTAIYNDFFFLTFLKTTLLFKISQKQELFIKKYYFVNKVRKYSQNINTLINLPTLLSGLKPTKLSRAKITWNSYFYDYNHQYASFFLKKLPVYAYPRNFTDQTIVRVNRQHDTTLINLNSVFEWVTGFCIKILLSKGIKKIYISKLFLIKSNQNLYFNFFKLLSTLNNNQNKKILRQILKLFILYMFGNLKYIIKTEPRQKILTIWISLIMHINQKTMGQYFSEENKNILYSNTDSFFTYLPFNIKNLSEKISFLKLTDFTNVCLNLFLHINSSVRLNCVFLPYANKFRIKNPGFISYNLNILNAFRQLVIIDNTSRPNNKIYKYNFLFLTNKKNV